MQLARRSTQSWKQRQLTGQDKYGNWGKAWRKWFPIQEKTPQCISSRHLTQSSLPPRPRDSPPHGIFCTGSSVCEGRRLGWGPEKKEGDLHLCFPSQTHTHAHPHKQLKVLGPCFDPTAALHTVKTHREKAGGLSWFSAAFCFPSGMFSIQSNTWFQGYCVRHRAFQCNCSF